MANKLQFTLWIGIVTCAASIGTLSSTASQGIAPRLFWGTGDDPQVGARAFVLCISGDSKSGELFVPPRMVKLSTLTLVEPGAFTFESEAFLGRTHRFQGNLRGGALEGILQVVGGEASNAPRRWSVTAVERHEPQTPIPGVAALRLTNVRFSRDGGDMVGVDLEIIQTARGPEGLIVFYESYWFEPVYVPFALYKIEQIGSTIHFETSTTSGPVRYHLKMLPGGTATLFRDDQGADGEGVNLRVGDAPLISCEAARRGRE